MDGPASSASTKRKRANKPSGAQRRNKTVAYMKECVAKKKCDSSSRRSLHADLQRDGYAVLRGFLSPEQLQEVYAHLEDFLSGAPARVAAGDIPAEHMMYDDVAVPQTLKQVQQLWRHDEAFFNFASRCRRHR